MQKRRNCVFTFIFVHACLDNYAISIDTLKNYASQTMIIKEK